MPEVTRESLEVLYDAETLAARIAEMGAEITRDHAGQELAIIGVLKGSFLFLADLVRHIELDMTVDFLGLSSYGSRTETSGVVEITMDLKTPIEGRHVLIVEDIVDTGLTMQYLLDNLATRRPASIQVATLLHKPARAKVEVQMDYVGFTIDDHFVVGYGLDFDQKHRNVPYIGFVAG